MRLGRVVDKIVTFNILQKQIQRAVEANKANSRD
jgi:hypothetical protein